MLFGRFKRCTAVLLSVALLATTACSVNKPQSSQSSSNVAQVAMGRYVERAAVFPNPLTLVFGLQQCADGSVQLFSHLQGAEDLIRYSSADGIDWSASEQDIMKKSGLTDINAIAMKPDGTLLLAGKIYTDEYWAKYAELDDGSGFIESDELIEPTMQFIEIAPDGSKKELAQRLSANTGGTISSMVIDVNGDIFVSVYNEAYQFGGVTGELKNTYSIDSFIDSIAVVDGRLAVASQGIGQIYDTNSGEMMETINELGLAGPVEGINVSSTYDDGTSIVAVGSDNAFYFCNSTGIYRRAAEGGVVERILDGSLVALNTPSMIMSNMLILPDGILVVLQNGLTREVEMKKYVFDSSVPTLPDKELRIYSLKENKTVRQAISIYQVSNPDTHVVLETPASDISTSDAIRALNTQLLAGKGPDIMILDGMPVASYLDKKVLMPLDEALVDGLMPNLVDASRSSDGKLYSIPARFAMPLIAGDSMAIASVSDISSFARMIESQHKVKPDARAVLQSCDSGTLLNTIYPIFADTLYTDGKPDEARLTEFLQALKLITEQQDPEERFITNSNSDAILDITWNSVNWYHDTDVIGLGHADSTLALAATTKASAEVAGGDVRPLSSADSHIYIPSTMLGINSGSSNKMAAGEFIKLVLSPEVQGCDLRDGLPVNRSALDTLLAPRTEEDSHMMTFGSTGEDGKTKIFSVTFPPQETINRILGWIEALDTPSMVDNVVLELLRSETLEYFSDRASLETTVGSIMQKLTLMQAE